ncbi:hypothetical protein HR45_01425 [Shewanella mangrovi]|uniref:Uncharacterized protein n=1 Tax=Shewanella mangrovi TaxID=1515746 RepID=A0A094K316_9GAMM|nr:hypothetical protein [Shewanella mangrovi]KFZ39086.1 hypothetical protein HR45_01425 [Shewanella mangrovi]
MRFWQKSTALLICSIALIAVLSTASSSMLRLSSQTTFLSSDEGRVGQAHILAAAVVVPETLSESFEPLEPRKRAKLQARYALLKEIMPLQSVLSHNKTLRYFMAPSRAPPVTQLV